MHTGTHTHTHTSHDIPQTRRERDRDRDRDRERARARICMSRYRIENMSGQGPPRIASRHILKKLFSYSIARLGELGGGKERARERESLHKVLKEIVASSMARQLWLCLAPHTHTHTNTHTHTFKGAE
jgi:hypothetical protein